MTASRLKAGIGHDTRRGVARASDALSLQNAEVTQALVKLARKGRVSKAQGSDKRIH
jgi:hypothetical protein